tara:strand:- start:1006 stop:1263 length:258 start_codon:yes stop_codon:yes gene_type:complete
MKLREELELLNKQVQAANKMLKTADQAIDIAINNLIDNASDKEMKQIQKQIVEIKELVQKAKKGENVDGQIQNIAKNIKDGSKNP